MNDPTESLSHIPEKGGTQRPSSPRRPGRTVIATVAAALTTLLAVAVLALGSGPAGATKGGHGGEHDPLDLATCFAFSIDQVGRGNLEAGIESFDPCLADNYVFEFVFFEGGPSIVCPGSDCPIQEFSSRADMRARFADGFFQDAGYLATQHQMLNLTVRPQGPDYTEVVGYIQANHFLADNSVDIAWNDYEILAARDGDTWKVRRETIVGTAFLNFKGGPVGGGDDDGAGDDGAAASGPIPVGADVTLRNTLQDPGAPEMPYPGLFGLPSNAWDEFSVVSDNDAEFATALAQPGTPFGDIPGLYEIDLTSDSISFTMLPAIDDPFWSNVFEVFPEGKFDRYYPRFSEPHNITSSTSSNPNVGLRIDSPTTVVVEISEGYEMNPPMSFSIDVE